MQGTSLYFLIRPTTYEVATIITFTLQVKKLRLKGMVSYTQCKSRVLLPQETQMRMRIALLEKLGGFVGRGVDIML